MVERDVVRRSYDEVAKTHAADRAENGRGTEILASVLESLPDSARVLDAGCGGGTPALAQLSESTTVLGLDFSREQLQLATERVPDVLPAQGNMTALPLQSSAFDAVVAYWSLIHIPSVDQPAVVDEFSRILRPGSRLLVCDGTNEWVGENPDWLDSGVEMAWDIAGAETTRAQLRAAGFEITER
jgi:ubiquinone/menaquinone biosynthesis C-methylase UbiE